MHKPRAELLTIWRWALVMAMFVPAFFISFLFSPGSKVWCICAVLWLICFLFLFLFYLPMRFQSLCYRVGGGQLELHSGVFYRRVRTMPLQSIQFVTCTQNLLDAVWNLATLTVTAAGGRARLYGLPQEDARILAAILMAEHA